ncbi:hypothetical protein D9M71_210530 [compost metagenome]
MQRHNTAQLATCLPTSLLLIIQIALLAEHVAWIGRLPDTIGIGHRVLTNMATPAVRMQSQSSCACVVLTASPYSSADLLLPCFGIDFFGTDGRWQMAPAQFLLKLAPGLVDQGALSAFENSITQDR